MPTAADAHPDPLDGLDTDVELPEAIPALPPLDPQHQQQQQQNFQQFQQHPTNNVNINYDLQPTNNNNFDNDDEASGDDDTNENDNDNVKPFKLTKTNKSTLQFKTDLAKSTRDTHPCGILHFQRHSRTNSVHVSEEHAFVWITNVTNPNHLQATLSHMKKFDFNSNHVVFIPYSSRRSWIEKYPLAFPHVFCGEGGEVTGFPHWSGGNDIIIGGVSGGGGGSDMMRGIMGSGGTSAANSMNVLASASATMSPTRGGGVNNEAGAGRKKKKIFPTAHLPNEERDELHIEIYRYFQWLQKSLDGASGSSGDSLSDRKRSAASGAAGINVGALRKLMEGMESTFKVVRTTNALQGGGAATVGTTATAKVGGRQASTPTATAGGGMGVGGTALPFLEEALGEPLGRLVEANKKDPVKSKTRSKRSRGLDFDDMYLRLVQFQRDHGHVNVPQKYSNDGQLGSWVANIRSKRKQMAKKGEEFELDIPEGGLQNDDEDDNNDDGDDDVLGLEEGGVDGSTGANAATNDTTPKKRGRKAGGGRQRLTRDRIHRLDAIGFQWQVANPNTKTWDERFEDLKEYQQLHGTTRVPRSSGTLGEWVHMQRRLYNKKDPKFLSRKAHLLEDIGFEWQPRKHALVSWDDNFNRLVEFGRINRHYNVDSPFPEGYIGDYEGEDADLVEAHRFHKWVRRIHSEYRTYVSGKGSRMLNDARVMQLREIGFQFM